MAFDITIPKLGMSISDVTLVEWKAKEGDRVEKGSVVLVIETEKTEWNIEAGASGFLHILVQGGIKAPIGRIVGLIAETDQELEALQKESPQGIFKTEVKAKEVIKAEPTQIKPAEQDETTEKGVIRISPVARKMAEENLIDITYIQGTGPGGRIVREDIERALKEQKKIEPPLREVSPDLYHGRKLRESTPLRGMRKVIAERMLGSLTTSAQLTLIGDFDATELVKLRETFKRQEERIDIRITYTEILVYGIANALKDHPDINVSLIDNEIKVWDDINIGVAVALGKEGLIVPVVKQADQKPLIEISRLIKMLVEKARAGKLLPDEVTGGTFTLSSIGAVGVSSYQTPVINQPESAILATGSIVEKPVVRNGRIDIAPMMSYSFTFDHRVINGFGAEQFLGRLRDLLETPGLLLLK